jgi:hypothetical protein
MKAKNRGRPFGHKLSEESKRKISVSKKGYKHTVETKNKITKSVTRYYSNGYAVEGTTMGVNISPNKIRAYNLGDNEFNIKIVEADNRYVYLTADFTYESLLEETGMKIIAVKMSTINLERTPIKTADDVGFGTVSQIKKVRLSCRFTKIKKPADFNRIFLIMESNFPNILFKINTLVTRKNGHEYVWKRKHVPGMDGMLVTKLILTEVDNNQPYELSSEMKRHILTLVEDFVVPRFCNIEVTGSQEGIQCTGYEKL